MDLLNVLPKDEEGLIILSPGGRDPNGVYVDGYVNPQWFGNSFPSLVSASVPLSDVDFANLKLIDEFWSMNADGWRASGII